VASVTFPELAAAFLTRPASTSILASFVEVLGAPESDPGSRMLSTKGFMQRRWPHRVEQVLPRAAAKVKGRKILVYPTQIDHGIHLSEQVVGCGQRRRGLPPLPPRHRHRSLSPFPHSEWSMWPLGGDWSLNGNSGVSPTEGAVAMAAQETRSCSKRLWPFVDQCVA
jgi:hypothetical protein